MSKEQREKEIDRLVIPQAMSMKLHQPGLGETEWFDITESEFEKITEILTK
jgi:hypothetical protein